MSRKTLQRLILEVLSISPEKIRMKFFRYISLKYNLEISKKNRNKFLKKWLKAFQIGIWKLSSTNSWKKQQGIAEKFHEA